MFGWDADVWVGKSPVASLLSEDTPKIILKGGLFEQLAKPGFTSFPQDKPEWLEVAKM